MAGCTPWPWPVWARYVRSFYRGLLVMMGEGVGLGAAAHEEVGARNVLTMHLPCTYYVYSLWLWPWSCL